MGHAPSACHSDRVQVIFLHCQIVNCDEYSITASFYKWLNGSIHLISLILTVVPLNHESFKNNKFKVYLK